MKFGKISAIIAAGVMSVAGAASASAAVVGVSPNVDLSEETFTITLGDGDATFIFGDSGETGPFGGPVPFATTEGSAEILSMTSIFGGRVARFTVGATDTIDGDLPSNQEFRSFDNETLNLENTVYIGLRFMLDENEHFGFARLGGLMLLDFAFEDTPGMGIQTQMGPFAPIDSNPVPVPAALPLFAAGIAGFGALARRRRATA